MRSRSNSAHPSSTVSINRPCDVIVSAHVSPSPRDLKPAFLPVHAASVSNRPWGRSRQPVKPSPSERRRRGAHRATGESCSRSVFAPLATSRNTFFASGLGQLAYLGVNALAVRRYALHPPINIRSIRECSRTCFRLSLLCAEKSHVHSGRHSEPTPRLSRFHKVPIYRALPDTLPQILPYIRSL